MQIGIIYNLIKMKYDFLLVRNFLRSICITSHVENVQLTYGIKNEISHNQYAEYEQCLILFFLQKK